MGSISCRDRDECRIGHPSHYKNYNAVYINGKTEIRECEPVSRSLASEFSVSMNAVLNRFGSSLSRRINVDAVDLQDTLKPFEITD